MGHLVLLYTLLFVLSAACAVAAVVFFFRLKIREIIREMTGKTASAEIARIREQGITRQGRARSLQSIIDATGTDNTLFSVEKLDLAANEPMTVILSPQTPAEPMTELLDTGSPAEPMTELLVTEAKAEPMTELLNAENPSNG